MPFLDRYWGLRPVLAVAVLIYTGQPMKGLYDDGLLSEYIGTPLDHIGDLLFFGLATIFFLCFAAFLALSAAPARRRKLRRLAAISGDSQAIPPAIVEYQTVEYDLAKSPVVIQVQISKDTKWLYILVALPLLLFCALAVIAFEVLATIVVISHWSASTSTSSDMLQALVVVGLGIVSVWGAILMSRYLPIVFGKPYGVTFGTDGVSYRSDLGREIFLRWDEMRLFEASSATPLGLALPPYSYRLYSSHASAYWHDPHFGGESRPTTSSTPGGTSLAVTIIHDRTGLAPRTFVKSLQAKESPGAASPAG